MKQAMKIDFITSRFTTARKFWVTVPVASQQEVVAAAVVEALQALLSPHHLPS